MNARGIPTAAYQVLLGGVPPPPVGVPPGQVWQGGTRGGVPPTWTWLGYPPPPPGPGWDTLPPHLDLAGVPPHLDLAGVPPPAGPGQGTPLDVDRQTDACQNITFPRTTYAVGNNYETEVWILELSPRMNIFNVHPCLVSLGSECS